MATKTYYHNVPNSRYIDKVGGEHLFRGGQLTTSDPDIIADLDKQIANGNTVIRDQARGGVDKAAVAVGAQVKGAAELAAALKLREAEKGAGSQQPQPQ